MARLKVALMYFIENEMFNDAPLRITLRISTRGEVWAYTLLHVDDLKMHPKTSAEKK